MKIETEYFGEIEYTKEDIITFRNGLYGFETHHLFLPVSFDEKSDSLLCLQNLEDRHLSFIAVNPFVFFPEYKPELENGDYSKLGTQEDNELSYYALCVMEAHAEECRVNLRCPIVVNVKSREAVQVVLRDSSYSFRQPLGKTQQ